MNETNETSKKGKCLGVEPLQKNTTRILKHVLLSLMFCFGEGKTRIEPSKTWHNTIFSQRRPNWHLTKSRSNEQSAPSGQFNLIQISLCMKFAGLVEIVFTTRLETWFPSSRLATDRIFMDFRWFWEGRTKPFPKCFVKEVTVWSINGEPPPGTQINSHLSQSATSSRFVFHPGWPPSTWNSYWWCPIFFWLSRYTRHNISWPRSSKLPSVSYVSGRNPWLKGDWTTQYANCLMNSQDWCYATGIHPTFQRKTVDG